MHYYEMTMGRTVLLIGWIVSGALLLLDETGLMPIIFPEFHDLKGVLEENGKRHKDNFYHTLEVVDNLRLNTDNLWLLWAAVFHDIAKPRTKKFIKNQ